MLKLKRAYDDYQKSDGFRVLVDRLWPRGVKKEDAHIDFWAKELAPSTDLRKWFNHEPEKWNSFSKSYIEELKHNESMEELLELVESKEMVTLVYGAKDEQHNHAIVLLNFIKQKNNYGT
ncbi:uncharacterized protein YeaO (DUF488 family) [Pedobacter sp. UYP30]|uniref:DUF488 domain-containing protein n=1 Tax=Pedobacter sp. UYP30 TaxID=1756400 RepID=UPI003395BC34